MNKILIVLGIAAMLALPALATAKPSETYKRAAKQQCKDERGKSSATREAFEAKYHSFGRCVRVNAAEEAGENASAHGNAAKDCKAERLADPSAFAAKYGTNPNAKNAFGKCVSSKAKARKDEADAKDAKEAREFKNAAKECAAERGQLGREPFAAKYGTNAEKSNAFGMCVSRESQESRA